MTRGGSEAEGGFVWRMAPPQGLPASPWRMPFCFCCPPGPSFILCLFSKGMWCSPQPHSAYPCFSSFYPVLDSHPHKRLSLTTCWCILSPRPGLLCMQLVWLMYPRVGHTRPLKSWQAKMLATCPSLKSWAGYLGSTTYLRQSHYFTPRLMTTSTSWSGDLVISFLILFEMECGHWIGWNHNVLTLGVKM